MGKKKKVARTLREQAELMHWAWPIIASAYGGNWDSAPAEWRDAAETWRDAYHNHLNVHPLPTLVPRED